MRYRVLIDPEAELELAEIFAWLREQAPINAERWLRKLHAAVGSLEQYPRRFAFAREQVDFPEELRQMIVASYRVIFTIEHNVVRVLHVRHAARRPLEGPNLHEPPPMEP